MQTTFMWEITGFLEFMEAVVLDHIRFNDATRTSRDREAVKVEDSILLPDVHNNSIRPLEIHYQDTIKFTDADPEDDTACCCEPEYACKYTIG